MALNYWFYFSFLLPHITHQHSLILNWMTYIKITFIRYRKKSFHLQIISIKSNFYLLNHKKKKISLKFIRKADLKT